MALLLHLPSRDARLTARLTAALGREHALVRAASWSAVPALIEREQVHGIVVDASTAKHLPLSELAWLVRQHPAVATVVVLDPGGRELELFRLGRQGVDCVVLLGHDELEPGVRAAVENALARGTARRVTRRLDGHVPPELVEALAWAVEHAHTDPGPGDLARSTARDVRGLRRALRRAELPAPSRILLWGRLLRAAQLLDREDVSVGRVAHQLGYAAGSSLARALRRETGLPPSEIRSRGGIACVLEALLASGDVPARHTRPPAGRTVLVARERPSR